MSFTFRSGRLGVSTTSYILLANSKKLSLTLFIRQSSKFLLSLPTQQGQLLLTKNYSKWTPLVEGTIKVF